MYFYIILLQNHKYYVLFSSNSAVTIDNINEIKNIDWLLINRPIHIIRKIPYHGQNIDDYVYEYMRIYGKNSIRGGTYTNAVLTTKQNLEITERVSLDIREPSISGTCDENKQKQSFCHKIYKIICMKKYYSVQKPLLSDEDC